MLCVAMYSIGMFFYTNNYYWAGEILRLGGVLWFVFTILFNTHDSKNIPLCLKLLSVWIVILTLRLPFANGQDSFIGNSTEASIAKLFLRQQFVPSLFPLILFTFKWYRPINLVYFAKISALLALFFMMLYPFAFVRLMQFRWIAGMSGWNELIVSDDVNIWEYATFGIICITPPGVVLFWRGFIDKRIVIITCMALIGQLLIYLYLARRAYSLELCMVLSFAWMFYVFSSNTSKRSLLLFSILGVTLLFVMYYYYGDRFLNAIVSRGFSDTRSGVESHLYDDMRYVDWLIGRGWFGTYYEPIFGRYRPEIETGYLVLVLRGGCIYLFLYLWVLLEAVYKGLIKSQNRIVKSFAIIIIVHILMLYPWGWPWVNLSYLSIWLGAYMCLNNKTRNMSDNEISEQYFKIYR